MIQIGYMDSFTFGTAVAFMKEQESIKNKSDKEVYNMKRLGIVIGIILLIAAIAYPVFGHGPGWAKKHPMLDNRGGGPGYCWQYDRRDSNLTSEQRTRLDQLSQKFSEKTAPLRDKIWAKSDELNTVLNSPEPDTEKAKALQREISELRSQLAEHRLAFEIEERKINPDFRSGGRYGKGYGRHMKGYGSGKGYGRHMRDYGPGYGPGGSCWN
jgi:Spy/CpxP family protein refolding chaperone